MTNVFNKTQTKEFRRFLRKNTTPAEYALWKQIKADKLGVRFRRQYGIGKYIVDFYCPLRKLVVEIDGESHLDKLEYEDARANFLESLGLLVVRFTNQDIFNNLEGVVEKIVFLISTPPLSPSYQEGETRRIPRYDEGEIKGSPHY